MRATLSFNLPEESEDHRLALDAGRYQSVLQELDNHLRSLIKYTPESTHEQYLQAFEDIREKLHELANNENVSLF